jgi:ChrR Cupin-like domain
MRTSYRRARVAALMIVTSLIVGSPASAQEQKTTRPTVGEGHQIMGLTPAELTWTPGPPMLPSGARMALIEGGPDKPGPFTFRLKFPANYRIPAHWHPRKTTVTVISGTFHMGHGDMLDTANGKVLPAGSIFEMPATIHHFGWASEETIIQHHGVGPFSMQYLNPADDPRQK